MAINKAKRSNPLAQLARRCPNPDPQVKSQLFETLRHLNRGFALPSPCLTACKD
jgi:hypothetical protein